MSGISSNLRLYNTLMKREEEFTTLEPKKVRMYTCGPTVYGRPHIGNYSSFLMADLLRRWLEVKGYSVKHVKNITDVGHLVADADEGEDKIEKQAKKEKKDPLDVAKKYEAEFLADEAALRIKEPFARPRATETIKEMIATIQTLMKNGNAYETGDGIYFDVHTFKEYGKLSGNTLDALEAGSRVEVNEEKRHPADFALWKKCVGDNSKHLLRWTYPEGERIYTEGEDAKAGFPGWHIECTAMSRKFLGEQLDIHTGGEDNIFPHHECEIAQSECSGKAPFSRFWLHKRRIDMGELKMSKSLGNVLSVPDIVAKGFSPLDLRYLFLSVHYRTQLKFMEKGLEDARKARRKIVEWMSWMTLMKPVTSVDDLLPAETVSSWSDQFADAMNADLNTPAALAIIFEAMNATRVGKYFDAQGLNETLKFIAMVRKTFGCFEPEEETVPEEVQDLAKERDAARLRKDFKESDRLRDELQSRGFEVRDTKEGTKVRKK
ncbi:MAG: cysteine--tRNA ligase [Candidatus Peribacteraceae bacterium]